MNTPDKGTMECLKEYMTCMEQLIPTLPPMPPSVQCVKDLYECFTKNEVGNFACVKTFGSCLNQELPSYIQACNSEVQQCWNSVTGYMDRFKCCTSFAYCFLNGPTAAPSATVFDAIEEEDQSNDLSDAAKCKGDFGKCLKEEKGKNPKICFKKLGDCMVALIPPYVIQCKDKAKQCYNNASGLKDKLTCGKEFAICISNGAPTLAPPTS
ncbi:uncharacterized protein [Porites lutea]